jgi:DNA polymerase
MRLPSGRCLHYHRQTLEPTTDKRARKPAYKIMFWGTLEGSTKGFVQKETYGGRLAENATQAVARDVQAEAMLRVDEAGYPIVMHTHDEIVAEVLKGTGSVEHMAETMCQRPSWAEWWPIRGAGWRDDMYQKD